MSSITVWMSLPEAKALINAAGHALHTDGYRYHTSDLRSVQGRIDRLVADKEIERTKETT